MKYLLIILLLAGCYSPKNARKQVAKVDINYPDLLVQYCRDKFPVIERIVKGDSVFVTDTLTDLVFIPSDTVTVNDTVRIIKTLPGKTITVTNTITRVDTVHKENTAALAACAIARDGAIKLANDNAATAAKFKKRSTIYGFILLGLIIAIGVWTYFKIKGK